MDGTNFYALLGLKLNDFSAAAAKYYIQGLVQLLKSDFSTALTYFKMAVGQQDEYVEAWSKIGFCQLKLSRPLDAIAAFRQVIQLDPLNSFSHYQLGMAFAKNNQHIKAISAFEQAIRIDPQFVNGYYAYGLSCYYLGRSEEAAKIWKTADGISGKNLTDYINTNPLDEYWRKVISACSGLIKSHPDISEARLYRGLAYLALGNKNAALNEYMNLQKQDRYMAQELFNAIYH